MLCMYDNATRLAFFSMPQQAEVLREHTDLRVGALCGEMAVDWWDGSRWERHLAEHDVLVSTPQARHLRFNPEFLIYYDELCRARSRDWCDSSRWERHLAEHDVLVSPPQVGIPAGISYDNPCLIEEWESQICGMAAAESATWHNETCSDVLDSCSLLLTNSSNAVQLCSAVAACQYAAM